MRDEHYQLTELERQQLIKLADIELAKIRSKIRHRHSYVRHNELKEFINTPSFFKLCDIAEECPHEQKRIMRWELKRAESEGRVLRKGGAK